ncbi:MAG: hypothetical protein ACOC3I_10915 [Verrucomicrobiota bacterium]
MAALSAALEAGDLDGAWQSFAHAHRLDGTASILALRRHRKTLANIQSGICDDEQRWALAALLSFAGYPRQVRQLARSHPTDEPAWRYLASLPEDLGAEIPFQAQRRSLGLPPRRARRLAQAWASLETTDEAGKHLRPLIVWLEKAVPRFDPKRSCLSHFTAEQLQTHLAAVLETRRTDGFGEVELALLDRLRRASPAHGPLLVALGDLLGRRGETAAAIAAFQQVLPLHKHPERIRLRLLALALQVRDRRLAAQARASLETPVGRFQAAIATCEFVEALNRGFDLLDTEVPSADWVEPLLDLLFELNLTGAAREVVARCPPSLLSTTGLRRHRCRQDSLSVPGSEGFASPWWQAWTDDPDPWIRWCACAAALAGDASASAPDFEACLCNRPAELSSPLSQLAAELQQRLELRLFLSRHEVSSLFSAEAADLLPRSLVHWPADQTFVFAPAAGASASWRERWT